MGQSRAKSAAGGRIRDLWPEPVVHRRPRLVVDEPVVGLDAGGRTELLAIFDDVYALGRALLVATHEPTTVARASG